METMNCIECYRENPEKANMCDKCKADTLCEAFKMWYYINFINDESRCIEHFYHSEIVKESYYQF